MIRVDFIVKLKKGNFNKWKECNININDICNYYGGEVLSRKFDTKTRTKKAAAYYPDLESLLNSIAAITIFMAENGFKEEYKVVETRHSLLNKMNKERALELLDELA